MAARVVSRPLLGGKSSSVARTFLDSNILIYAEDSAHPGKQQRAVELVLEHARRRSAILSLQILGEYFSVVVRKLHLDSAIARSQVEFYSRFPLFEVSLPDVFAATDIQRLHGIAYWDALIIRSAERSGCSVLLSENMQHGREINGVKIVNPFL